MEMLSLSIPATNRFASEYLAQSSKILPFFHYQYHQKSAYQERLNELKNRSFYRKKLADHIESFMDPFPSSEKVNQSIEKLKADESVVVIGGQQAGIVTGPLYTIHKVISIIVLAQQKEQELGVPVIPVFWIAGEDHDYVEVNHIYAEINETIQKLTYPESIQSKKMVSDICLDKPKCFSWVKEIVEIFGETEHTKQLLEFTKLAIEHSDTMVDFFAYIIMELFKDFGLLIIDSGDKQLRDLEQSILLEQLQEYKKITEAVFSQQDLLKQSGFPNTIEINHNAVNLFYYDEMSQSRILLEYQPETDKFIGKNSVIQFSFDSLIELISSNPEKFSNNVVTRPLTQEWLFPTLAFIAGPGEIAYWSELKQVFEHFELKMPLIVPRLNITILERSIETDLQELGYDLETVIRDGVSTKKTEFLNDIKDQELAEHFSQLRQEINKKYEVISQRTEVIDKGLLPLLEKNEAFLEKQISFIENKIEEATEQKYAVKLSKIERVKNALRPNGAPQERVLNPMYFLNKYGLDFVKRLASLDYQFDGEHKVVKL